MNSYIRRRDLHTVLPRHTNPTSMKTNSMDEKSETNRSSNLKRSKLNSTSSETSIGPDSDVEIKEKRLKLEQIDETNDESSPKPSELNLTTE